MRRFGQTAIATPANYITIARIVLTVPTVLLIIDQGSSWLTVSLWFVLTATDGLDGWLARARRHHALRRVPRPARRQGPRARRLLRPRHQRRLLVGGRDPSPCARSASRSTARSPAVGASRCRRASSANGRPFLQFLAVGVVLFPPMYSWATFHDVVLWIAVADLVALGLRHPAGRVGRAAGAEGGQCGVTSSPSVPSCCSARSSTPTARGSASSSPRSASTRASTARWATTSAAWSRACASCSNAPTPSSCAVASGPRPTTSPVRRSPRSWASSSSAARSSSSRSSACSACAAGRCRPTTCARPTCPRAATTSRTRSAPRPACSARSTIDGVTKVVYAVPGVPYEMVDMVTEHVLPDLLERSGERAVIVSRSLKTWGASESGLAEMIARASTSRPTRRSRSSRAASRASTCG